MPSRFIETRVVAVLFAGGLALTVAGCTHNNVHAAAPVAAPPVPSLSETGRPMNTAPDTDATPPIEITTTPPSVAVASAPPPVSIPAAKPVPAPRKPAEQPVIGAAAEPPARAPAPQISPQLSPGDRASYERKTREDLAAAEKNVQRANGKQLNASQQDMVEKVRSFLAEARDASKSGDWARAQNLALKARLISIELVNSF
jgi:hypothetical protein